VITQDERTLLEELRTLTMDTITVDDFEPHELRSASYYDRERKDAQSQEAA
jgi:acyl-CoA dehydrogenase